MSLILSLLLVFLISLVTFFPSFQLALFGDDWLAFFRYTQHLGPKSAGVWNHLTYYLTPYGPQDILMGVLQKIYDFQSTNYYVISYFFRVLASLSFYPLVLYLTKNRLAAFFAVLFFSITTTGLDTTNWVFNMPTYVTIALFNLSLYFSLKQREKGSITLLIFAASFYYFAYITTPIRMHGSLIFLFSLEVFWVLQERKITVIKKAAIRFAVMLGVFLIIRYTGHSQGPPEEVSERFSLGIKTIIEMLSKGRVDFLLNPIIMFGSMIVPDFILPSFQIISKSKLLLSAILPSFIGFLTVTFLLLNSITSKKVNFLKKITVAYVAWIVIVSLIFHFNLATFNGSLVIFLSLIGGFGIILILSLLLKFFKQKNISTALFLGLSWSILSFFFAWWWVPTSIFSSTYRYLIVSAIGISIILATIISLGKDKNKQLFIFALLCSILILHIISTRTYINYVLDSHGQTISNKIWASIPYVEEIGKSKDPIIFYFEGDGSNGGILHDVLTFGFPPHVALFYGLRAEDPLPVPMSDFKEVVSAVTDGKTMPAYGYPVKPVSIDRIYGFSLQGKNNLINVTQQLREKLIQIKSN